MIHRREDVETVAASRREVVGAMTRRCMNETRSRFERDVVAEDEDAVAIEERVTVFQAVESGTFESCDDVRIAPSRSLRNRFEQTGGDDVQSFRNIDDDVFELGMERDGEVRRKRPGCRRPDDGEERPLRIDPELFGNFRGRSSPRGMCARRIRLLLRRAQSGSTYTSAPASVLCKLRRFRKSVRAPRRSTPRTRTPS
jgi:hypothetical protein